MKRFATGFAFFILGAGAAAAEGISVSPAPAPSTPPAAAASPAAPAPGAATVTLVSAEVGTGVEDHKLQGQAATFDAGAVEKVYFLTAVKASFTPAAIHHRWFLDGQQVGDVPLSVKGSPWSTYSYMIVMPGAWKVELMDDAGAVLSTLEFSVTKSDPAPASSPSAQPAQTK